MNLIVHRNIQTVGIFEADGKFLDISYKFSLNLQFNSIIVILSEMIPIMASPLGSM